MMPTRTEAIKRFLTAKTHADLAGLYSHDMECQVNVAQDDGERVEGDYQGRQWHGWSNGLETWKSFRIPYKANSKPEYTDKEMSFDLVNHSEGIGMTGWNWKLGVSKWVAFDFDAITGHSDKHASKLTPNELEEIKNVTMAVDWITIRKSTSGKGLHLYVYLDDIRTVNHTEHSALARAILGKLSAITGYDFQSKVDGCGGNMWVWHRKMTNTDGLTLIKKGIKLYDIPPNWRDHLQVVTGKRRKVNIPDVDNIDDFEELLGQGTYVTLDEEHKALITYLTEKNLFYWWDQDHHMLVTHTLNLQDAYDDLNMKGIFKTNSPGTNRDEQNCFAYPIKNGGWVVRRFTKGINEDLSWEQDGNGWTKCFLNRSPNLKIAAVSSGGLENERGEFIFRHAQMAQDAALKLNANVTLPPWALGRKASIKQHKDGRRIVLEMDHQAEDSMEKGLQGWLLEKGKWKRIFDVAATETRAELTNYDDLVRHLVTEGSDDAGWVIKTDEEWQQEPYQHIKVAVESLGFKATEVRGILGASIFKPWKLVNQPFQPEYIGDRQWNRDASQYRFMPTLNRDDLSYPCWMAILDHIGKNLQEAVANNGWAKANGILTGADYLKCWIASLLQEPLQPLPYLFLYGPQGSGKSILPEALSLLFTKGYARADMALKSKDGFNGELRSAILCSIEETDLNRNKQASSRIKDWVTSLQLPVHVKCKTPFLVPNSTHWIQTDNDQAACPVFPGDTRVVVIYVESVDPIKLIPKKKLIPMLEKEAPDFLSSCLGIELPASPDRLNIPVVTTAEKHSIELGNRTMLEVFIEEQCHHVPGEMIKFSALYDRFREWLEPSDVNSWSKIRFGQYFSANMHKYPKGRSTKNGQWHIGNISLTKVPVTGAPYIVQDDMLREGKL